MPSSKEFFKLDLKNKLILVRVDLNLPVVNGVVQDETRLQSVLPTIQEIIKKGGKIEKVRTGMSADEYHQREPGSVKERKRGR